MKDTALCSYSLLSQASTARRSYISQVKYMFELIDFRVTFCRKFDSDDGRRRPSMTNSAKLKRRRWRIKYATVFWTGKNGCVEFDTTTSLTGAAFTEDQREKFFFVKIRHYLH